MLNQVCQKVCFLKEQVNSVRYREDKGVTPRCRTVQIMKFSLLFEWPDLDTHLFLLFEFSEYPRFRQMKGAE